MATSQALEQSASLRIAFLAPPWEPVSPSSSSRIARSICALAAALVRRGHEIHLIAPTGSSGAATVHEIEQGYDMHQVGRQCFEIDYASRALAEVMRLTYSSGTLDVLHDHCGVEIVAQASFIPVPMVHTIRGEVGHQLSKLYATYSERVSLVATNPRQLSDASPAMRLAALIPDPVDVSGWSLQTHKEDGVLWIWRLEPLHDVGGLIKLVKDANLPLSLTGPVLRGQERWFEAEIAPHLSGQVRYLGTPDGPGMSAAISHARALLVLGGHSGRNVDDIVHALACGTPVVIGRSSEHDIIQDGVNGFIAANDASVVAALQDAEGIDPRVCRESALMMFGADVSAGRYESLYRHVADRFTTVATAASTPSSRPGRWM